MPKTVAEAVAAVLDVYLYAQPAIGGAGADQSWVVGPIDVPNSPQAFGCFLYNAIYANFLAELFNTVSLVESVVDFLSSTLAPGYTALGCEVNFPDASGTGNTWRSMVMGQRSMLEMRRLRQWEVGGIREIESARVQDMTVIWMRD
jgi:hypothetical protein